MTQVYEGALCCSVVRFEAAGTLARAGATFCGGWDAWVAAPVLHGGRLMFPAATPSVSHERGTMAGNDCLCVWWE
jgi:hypothetical protein